MLQFTSCNTYLVEEEMGRIFRVLCEVVTENSSSIIKNKILSINLKGKRKQQTPSKHNRVPILTVQGGIQDLQEIQSHGRTIGFLTFI